MEILDFFLTNEFADFAVLAFLAVLIYWILSAMKDSVPAGLVREMFPIIRGFAEKTPTTIDDRLLDIISGSDGELLSIEEALMNLRDYTDEAVELTAETIKNEVDSQALEVQRLRELVAELIKAQTSLKPSEQQDDENPLVAPLELE